MMNKIWKKIVKPFITLFAGVLVLFGCGTADNTESSAERENIEIVATTSMITDLIKVIGGDRVEVNRLMGPGIDPHGYQASASDVDALTEADIVAYNGMHLEGQMGDIFSELESMDKEIIVLEEIMSDEDTLDSEEEDMPVDPHIWFSVPIWAKASDYVTESLSEYDPDGAEYYQSNNDAYQVELEELDTYIRERVEEVPENSRYLVTAHDAFNYFGNEYGFEVVGLQGLNTQTEAGTRDVSDLADFIVENEINAIFVESSVPTRTIESLQEAVSQRGSEVEIGGELFSDALGDESQDAETYIKMYKHNTDTIVDALN